MLKWVCGVWWNTGHLHSLEVFSLITDANMSVEKPSELQNRTNWLLVSFDRLQWSEHWHHFWSIAQDEKKKNPKLNWIMREQQTNPNWWKFLYKINKAFSLQRCQSDETHAYRHWETVPRLKESRERCRLNAIYKPGPENFFLCEGHYWRKLTKFK